MITIACASGKSSVMVRSICAFMPCGVIFSIYANVVQEAMNQMRRQACELRDGTYITRQVRDLRSARERQVDALPSNHGARGARVRPQDLDLDAARDRRSHRALPRPPSRAIRASSISPAKTAAAELSARRSTCNIALTRLFWFAGGQSEVLTDLQVGYREQHSKSGVKGNSEIRLPQGFSGLGDFVEY